MQYAYIYIHNMWSHNVLFPAGSIAFLFAKPFVSSHGRPVCLPLQCPWWRSLQDTMHSLQSMKMSTWFMPGFGTDGPRFWRNPPSFLARDIGLTCLPDIGKTWKTTRLNPKPWRTWGITGGGAHREVNGCSEFGTSFSTRTGRGPGA